MTRQLLASTLTMAALVASPAFAVVGADEAAKLKTTLTPLGAEKAGNQDGSIPAWGGGYTKGDAGAKVGDIPSQLFANEKPIAQISAANVSQHAARLSEGTQALLKKFPDSFKVNVYPSHRTMAAPSYVYDNTFKNATQCKLVDGGRTVAGCFGGIPFPIPQAGVEVVWNHLLRFEPESISFGFKNLVGSADGSRTLATRNEQHYQYPYYYKDGSAEKWSGEYFLMRFSTTAPPFKVGESLVIRDSINPDNPRQAWQYLVGQRRVRRAPTVAYDTPDFVASGSNYFDEVIGFFGHPDRYDWKLVGKQEIYVPYNNNGFVTASEDEAFTKHHVNPERMRWELHRVWVVEATVGAGKRHAVPKRRFYFDEDSYALLLLDGFDAEGKLWRTSQIPSFVVPSVPAVLIKTAIVYNLQAGTMSAVQALNGETYNVVARRPEIFFTGDAIAAEAAR